MVNHAELLRLQTNRTGLTLGANALGPLRMPRRTVSLYAIVRLTERRHVRTLHLRFVGCGIDLAKVRVERKVLDLLFREVLGVVRLERHTVVAHSPWAMLAHSLVFGPSNLAISLIEQIIEWGLLDYIPWIGNIEGWGCGLGTDRHCLFLNNRSSI